MAVFIIRGLFSFVFFDDDDNIYVLNNNTTNIFSMINIFPTKKFFPQKKDDTCVLDYAPTFQDVLASKRYITDHHNDGVICLRFPSFEHARAAHKILNDLTIGDREVSVEFSPRRLTFVQADENGLAFVGRWMRMSWVYFVENVRFEPVVFENLIFGVRGF